MSVGFTVEEEEKMFEKGYVLDESVLGKVYYPKDGIRIVDDIVVKYVDYPWISCFEVEGIEILKGNKDMNNKKIVVAGHLCADITPEILLKTPAKDIKDVLHPGTLFQVGPATGSVGGAVGNTGLALKKFGNEVILIGKIADDPFGHIIESVFEEYGVSGNLIYAENESTSYSIVIAPPGLDRMFLHHAGPNETFCYADLDFDLIATADHFHFGYPTVMRELYLNGCSELVRIFEKVKELGLTTSLDMAAVDVKTEAAAQDWKAAVKKLMPYVDFFVPSIEEIAYMIDKNAYEEWEERAGDGEVISILNVEKDIKPLADKLIGWGAKCVLLKCGAAGMYLGTASSEVMSQIGEQFVSWDNLDIFEKSYVADRVLSGAGAGDTSIAAFLKAALEGYPAQRCLQLAAGTGACCVTAYDALSGLLSFEELGFKIDCGWAKNN